MLTKRRHSSPALACMRFAVRSPPRIGLAFPGSRVERSATTAVAPVSLIGAKTDTFALRYVRKSEISAAQPLNCVAL